MEAPVRPNRPTLVLNPDGTPLGSIELSRACQLVLMERATTLVAEGALHSPSTTLPAPSVIVLRRWVRPKALHRVPVTTTGVRLRDKGLCGYCGLKGESIDHVIPRSRGGRHEWTNVVWACLPCNGRKADRMLADLGWTLRTIPREPSPSRWIQTRLLARNPGWKPYLPAAP